jgi:valyl-tRNA synthetase
MIMMGLHFTKQVPFKDVYIHALVRDAEGQKMSKSKGNVIDPLGIMDQYGTDALRFTLAAMASPGRDVKLSEQRIEGYRNFANKLWNASRFVLMNIENQSVHEDQTNQSLVDRWITTRLNRCINTVWQDLETYRFDEAANYLYQFVWHEFCDWYIELAKPRLAPETDPGGAAATRATMVTTLETTLRLLHPFMPFITEEIWQKLPHKGDTIVLAQYPQKQKNSDEDQAVDRAREDLMEEIIDIITAIRSIRSNFNVSPAQRLEAGLTTATLGHADRIERHGSADIKRLAKLSDFQVGPHIEAPRLALKTSRPVGELFIVLEGVDLLKEQARIQKSYSEANTEYLRLDAKLRNPDFGRKAPEEVIADHETRRKEAEQQSSKFAAQLLQISNLLGGK